MARNFTDSPSNGATQAFNGVTYTYNSSKAIWTARTSAGISLTDLSVGSEPSASGDGAVAYNNTTGVITYTPPVIGSGGTTTVYNTASLLPLTGNTAGDMAFAKDNNRFYVWNGAGWYSVALVNASPTISSGVASAVNLATDGTATVVTITAADPEGTSLTFGFSVTSGSLTNGGGASATVAQGTGANTNVFTVTPTTTEAYAGNFSLTFTATDGISTATSTGAFTLVFASPQHFSTAVKVQTSGNNTRTNSVFDDSSTVNHTISPTGNVYQTTLTPYTPLGRWSHYFDGVGDVVTYGAANDFVLGTGDFCVEMWIKQEAYVNGNLNQGCIFSMAQGGDGQGIAINLNSANKFLMLASSGAGGWAAAAVQLTVGLTLNKWTHLAWTRHSNNFYLYLDGKKVWTYGVTASLINTNNLMAIGGRTTSVQYFKGWISNFRLVKGSSVYGSTEFTPSHEPLTAITNTVLLACHGNRFKDFSGGSAKTVVVHGDPEVVSDNPITASDAWSPSLGGSAYITGTGDNLRTPVDSDFTFGTGDFSIECWLNIISQASSYASVIEFRGTDNRNDSGAISLVYDNSKMYVYNDGFKVNNLPRVLNRWQHIVYQRRTISGTSTHEFYINGVIVNTGADSTNWTQSNLWIGTSNWSDHGNFYIADLKINKGSAAYSGAFTPPTSPVSLDSYTKLKLNFAQAGVFDASSKVSLSLIGAGVQESNAQTKYATTNLRLSVGNSRYGYLENLVPPRTDDFQVETWVYLDSSQTNAVGAGKGIFRLFGTTAGNSNTHNGVALMVVNGRLYLNLDYGGSNFPDTGDTIARATWHHLAYVRRNGKIYIFMNGVEVYSVANTIDFTGTTGYLGAFYNYQGHCIDGYLEDFRYLKGHTTYPNERPQTKLTAVTNTKLLTANASSIGDSSTSNHTITNVNSVASSSFTPSDSTADHSYNFNGSNQRLELPSSSDFTFGTGDFSLEFYVNVPSTNSANGSANIVDLRNGTAGLNVYIDTSRNLTLGTETSGSWASFGAVQVEYNNWYHVSVNRQSSVLTYCVNGVVIATASNTNNFTTTGGKIGDRWNSSPTQYFKGYLCDLRIIKGSGNGFGTSFTPPTAAL